MILGGYGNFGKRISASLAKDGISIVIAGRDKIKAGELAEELHKKFPDSKIETAIFDANTQTDEYLPQIKPFAVINTCGPFQNNDYSVAETCIQHGVHYIDLADGRDFVTGITSLNEEAKKKNVSVISGASTVPGLSSAVLEHYKNEFSNIDLLCYGISPGQKTDRGLATTKAILTYVGKKLKPFQYRTLYGWQFIYRQKYPEIGYRWMATCDIPDLDLLPRHYNIKEIHFAAGMENSILHFGIWFLSWLVRLGLPLNLPKHAGTLLKISHWFDVLGTDNGVMHIIIKGKDRSGKPHEIKWFIIAKNGDGPQIPCVPAILLAKKLLKDELREYGAKPCLGILSLDEYMNELKDFNVKQLSSPK